MQSYCGQGDVMSTACNSSTAGAMLESPGSMAEHLERLVTGDGKSKAENTPHHGGWSLWRSIKQSFSDEPTESSRAGIKSKVCLLLRNGST